MFNIVRYTPERKSEWDGYVKASRNGTFLFQRDYMDYHADRFDDCSLMFYKGKLLYALLPAHKKETTFCSHNGLTYGGLIMQAKVTAVQTQHLFNELNNWLRKEGFRKVIYKPVPWIYHQVPSEEDLFALFWTCNARLSSRNIGTLIMLQQPLSWRKDHRRRLNLAHQQGITVNRSDDLEGFWQLLNQNLKQRFDAKPVHTLEEMQLLKARFPREIVLYAAYLGEEMVGGILFYETPQVLRGQYSATNDKGKQTGAMETIYEQVLKDYPSMRYLDFGTSTDGDHCQINEGLLDHKEAYGGRALCFDTYEWDLEEERSK